MTKAKKNNFNITIIGAGRVGLPLALTLENKGFSIAIKDKDPKIGEAFSKKKMPFEEPGFEKLISKSKIECYLDKLPNSEVYIITVGTPLNQHIETNLNQIKSVVDELIAQVNLKGKTIILRSTVAPNVSRYLVDYIESKTGLSLGKDFFLAMCPERIVEGMAFKELTQLPQIIGVEDDGSFRRATNVFKKMLPENKIFRGTFLEAELAKLFTNIYRYINFAIPNYFVIMAQSFGVDAFHLFDIMNTSYDRNKGLKNPGLTAGTCLRKDFGMINECISQTDIILQAYKINEFMPKFLIDLVGDKIKGSRVGVLGYTFKADVDDTRDTLTAKLIRYAERKVPKEIKISDYNLPKGKYSDKCNSMEFNNISTDDLIKSSDIIFIATNHSKYYKIPQKLLKGKIVVDIWRVLSKGIIVNF